GGGKSPIIETFSNGTRKKNNIKDVVFADSALLGMFNLPVIYGDPDAALKKPYSLILTRTTALKLFGTENAVGETIHYTGDNGLPMDMTITAIIEDIPANSTVSFKAAGSLSSFYSISRMYGFNIDEDWRNYQYDTFIMAKGDDINVFTDKINKLWRNQEKILNNMHEEIKLIPFDDVYFHNNSKLQLILFLQLVGIFILAIAIVNFINLTIAKSASRAGEIGMRKVIGADRPSIIMQFLGESILISLLAAAAALMIVELIKPSFIKIIDKQIQFGLLNQPIYIFILISGIILTGIISGIYPAIILSAFKPASILKGEITKGKRGNFLRHILIVTQFAISIALVICTIMVSKQVNYLRTKNIGFNNKNIIHFKQSAEIGLHYNAFKQKLLEDPDIINVSRSNTSLGQELPISSSQELHGLKKSYCATTVDPDFIPTMGIQIIEGRPFSWDIASDFQNAAIVNETFIKEFELKETLGNEINFIDRKFKIIGVMKDFHYSSFHKKVEPSALFNLDWNSQINIRISSRNIHGAIQHAKKAWEEFSPDFPFEYEFLDKTYDKLYKSDEQFQDIINSFSAIAIFIACLGLLGLVSISVDRRIKEIGIRKIIGASVDSIVFTLLSEFLKWIALANIIAWPVAYYFMNKWLQNYAYHTELSWWMFPLAGGIALLIAAAAVSFQAFKAATANPVESLRYE
ncbi:MAG TPA: FtsX-like permease family protein, partial [Ignavibacteriaceae bacterium]|nr:FtsX-like permease family protein [Ignavibacteriaceae bacterium]